MPETLSGRFSTVTITGVDVTLPPLESSATTVTAYCPSKNPVVLQVVEQAPDVICGPTAAPPT
jgi:hypothetical protein